VFVSVLPVRTQLDMTSMEQNLVRCVATGAEDMLRDNRGRGYAAPANIICFC
jgi:hypothetical protein